MAVVKRPPGARTKRGRKRRRNGARRGRIVFLAALAVLVMVAGWHYWAMYRGLTAARDDLQAAQDELEGAGVGVRAEDVRIARGHFRDAREHLDSARMHVRFDPVIQGSRLLPGMKDQVNAVRGFLEIADMLVEVGDQATSAGDKAVAFRDTTHVGTPLTASLVQLLDDTDAEVERIEQLTSQAVERRRAIGDVALLPPLNRLRARLDEELPKLANSVEQARQAKDLLPAFLGFSGPRNYLVFALNSGELLPGGGLVTTAGILPVNAGVNGTFETTDSTTWLASWAAKGGGYIEPPGPLKRYLLRDYSWNLLVSNWDPDFPTWSQQAKELYELVHGEQRVDGSIAVDLTVLQRLLTVTGPKTIDVAGTGRVEFNADNAVLQLESLTRPGFQPAEDRKSVVGDLSEAVISDLLHLPSDRWSDAVDIIRGLGAERHIQVLSFDAKEQTIIRDVGWDGAMERSSGDYLQLNEASVASTKLNLIVKPHGSLRVDVDGLGGARHELKLEYRNPLPEWAKDKPPKLVSDLMLGGLYGGYLRVFGPAGLKDLAVQLDGVPGSIEDIGQSAGRDWFGSLMTLPSGATRTIVFDWTAPKVQDPGRPYRLLIQKQPGTDGLCLDLSVTRAGAPAKTVTVTGGGRDEQGRVCLTTDVSVVASF